jgi:hypothetical protein
MHSVSDLTPLAGCTDLHTLHLDGGFSVTDLGQAPDDARSQPVKSKADPLSARICREQCVLNARLVLSRTARGFAPPALAVVTLVTQQAGSHRRWVGVATTWGG